MEREPFDVFEFERIAADVPWLDSVAALVATSSTNEEAMRCSRDGAPQGTVIVADEQTAGRGRLDRTWTASPGTSLLVSWILRPHAERDRWPMYALATGVAAAQAARSCGVLVSLKWPNDLMCGDRKLGGILAETSTDAVVIGLGLNVRQDSFPPELNATSLLIERARPTGRAALLRSILTSFAEFVDDPAACLEEYRVLCSTIAADVRVERAGAPPIEGRATEITERGELIVGGVAVTAGDVVHLRRGG